jgi:hypothetical protein
MLRLKPRQRRVLIDRISELANFVVGSLFFGQFLIERPFSLVLALSSMGLWGVLIGLTFWLAAGRSDDVHLRRRIRDRRNRLCHRPDGLVRAQEGSRRRAARPMTGYVPSAASE